MWLCTQPKTFITNGIRKLMDQSNKSVEKLGYCIKSNSVFVLVYLL